MAVRNGAIALRVADHCAGYSCSATVLNKCSALRNIYFDSSLPKSLHVNIHVNRIDSNIPTL
jgi:hypothetical protein